MDDSLPQMYFTEALNSKQLTQALGSLVIKQRLKLGSWDPKEGSFCSYLGLLGDREEQCQNVCYGGRGGSGSLGSGSCCLGILHTNAGKCLWSRTQEVKGHDFGHKAGGPGWCPGMVPQMLLSHGAFEAALGIYAHWIPPGHLGVWRRQC